jgi:hypothetical protein
MAFVSAKTKCAVCAVGFFTMRHNGLQLGEVADLEALTFILALMFI